MKIKKIFEYKKSLWEDNDNWASHTNRYKLLYIREEEYGGDTEKDYEIVNFNKLDIKTITNYINGLSGETSVESDDNEIRIEVTIEKEDLLIIIYKVEDDYYFVSDEFMGNGYKCDTIEGVIQLFNEKVFPGFKRLSLEEIKLKEMKLKLMNYYNGLNINDIGSLSKIIKIIEKA